MNSVDLIISDLDALIRRKEYTAISRWESTKHLGLRISRMYMDNECKACRYSNCQCCEYLDGIKELFDEN
jgi:hypothetical protein